MVNVYLLRDDSGTPSGWAEIGASYRDRLVLLGATALSTGGSDTHSHTISGVSVGSASSAGNTWESSPTGSAETASSHSHTSNFSSTDAASNVPKYKTFRAVYKSVTGWDGKVPAGSIGFSESVPNADWARTESGSNYFIRISGTAGTVNDTEAHSHSFSGTLNNYTGSSQATGGSGSTACIYTHGHTCSGSTDSKTPDYYYWACGLIKASVETRIRKDTILLFDGDPGSDWTVLSKDGMYLKISATNIISEAGSYTTWTHNHANFSVTSTTSSTVVMMNYSAHPILKPHSHTVTGSFNNATCQPAYVKLIIAKALKDMGQTPRAVYIQSC